MKIALINSAGCELDVFKGETDQACEKIGEWIDTIREGDTIRFVEVDDEDDALGDYNYVGSRHHY